MNLNSRWTAAAVVGVAVVSAPGAAHAQGVTNPAQNPNPVTVTIDGQTYTDGKDTLPGYDDIACTAIPYVSYDFDANAVLYYDSDGSLLKTAKWQEWSRISTYQAWLDDQKKPTPTATAAPTQTVTSTPAPTSSGNTTQGTTQTTQTQGTTQTTAPSTQTTKGTTKTQTKSPTNTSSTTKSTSTKTQSSTTKSSSATTKTSSSTSSTGTSTSTSTTSGASTPSARTSSSTSKGSTASASSAGTSAGTDPAPVNPDAPVTDGGAPAPTDGSASVVDTGAPVTTDTGIAVNSTGGTEQAAANNGPGAVLAAADTTKYALASETVGSFENTRLAGIGILVALVALGFFCLAFGEVRQQLFGRRRPH